MAERVALRVQLMLPGPACRAREVDVHAPAADADLYLDGNIALFEAIVVHDVGEGIPHPEFIDGTAGFDPRSVA